MAEAILSGVAEGMIAKLSSVALQEIGVAWGAKEELESLQATLTTIKAVLLNTETHEGKTPELIQYLKRLKLVFDNADDVVDEFEIVALQEQVMRRNLTKKVRHFCSSSNPFVFRHRMGHAIKKIRKELENIEADRRIHITEINGIPKKWPETTPYLGKLKVFGRDEDKNTLLNHLNQSHEHEGIRVLPIVGIGGLGKTTLAKMIYNDESFMNNFEKKGWVCVSKGSDVSSIVQKIITAVIGVSCDGLSEGEVHTRLRQVLENKKFVLVLDDIWEITMTEWEELKNLLMVGEDGSKIIVTTRNHSVASIMHNLPIHNLKGLQDRDSLSLFVRWVLQEGEERLPIDLMSIGEEIVKKCKGIPLAIKTLGRLLNQEREKSEWTSIKDKEIWRIVQDKDDILPILRLSYDHLPSHLKQCFALLSTFAKDSVIMSTTLVCRWIALGFVQRTTQSEDLEKIGKGYINELFARSFIEINNAGYYLLIRMHDLMHDLALSVAQDEYAVVDFHTKNADVNIRHLTFHDRDHSPKEEVPICLQKLKNVRSVMHLGASKADTSFLNTCLERFKRLRVLYLPKSSFDSLPKNIKDLRHLRLLDLSYNENIKLLPDSICNLQGLQTLGLYRCSELKTLPRDFGKLISLRFLHLTTQDRSFSRASFEKLTSLRQLYISECYNLRSLFDESGEINFQSTFTSLLSLGIYDCKNLLSLPRDFENLTALESLAITGCRKLELLTDINGEGGLRSLQYLGIAELPTMVSLPPWIIQSAAKTLTQVVIVGCYNITSFPKNLTLRKLWIENCPRLTYLPNGINQDNTLKEIVIVNCPELVKRCERETGDDWQNISSVAEIYLDGINVQNPASNQSSGEKKWTESSSFLLMMEHVKDLEVALS